MRQSIFFIITCLVWLSPFVDPAYAQFGNTGGGATGAGGTGAGLGTSLTNNGLGAAANASSLFNQTSSNGFTGFTQNFGSGNTPFATGNLNLNSNAGNGVGTLAGGSTVGGRTGTTSGIGGLGGATGAGGLGGGLGGLTGGLGGAGGLGGFGGGLGGGLGGLGGLSGGFGGISGRSGLGGFGQSQFGNSRMGNNQQNQSALRTTMKPVVRAVPHTSQHVATRIQSRMTRIALPERYRNIQVRVEGRTAILTGVVESEADVLFISRLLTMEPGIDSVESQLEPSSPVVVPESIQAVPSSN